jgi:hypothetical protein
MMSRHWSKRTILKRVESSGVIVRLQTLHFLTNSIFSFMKIPTKNRAMLKSLWLSLNQGLAFLTVTTMKYQTYLTNSR